MSFYRKLTVAATFEGTQGCEFVYGEESSYANALLPSQQTVRCTNLSSCAHFTLNLDVTLLDLPITSASTLSLQDSGFIQQTENDGKSNTTVSFFLRFRNLGHAQMQMLTKVEDCSDSAGPLSFWAYSNVSMALQLQPDTETNVSIPVMFNGATESGSCLILANVLGASSLYITIPFLIPRMTAAPLPPPPPPEPRQPFYVEFSMVLSSFDYKSFADQSFDRGAFFFRWAMYFNTANFDR